MRMRLRPKVLHSSKAVRVPAHHTVALAFVCTVVQPTVQPAVHLYEEPVLQWEIQGDYDIIEDIVLQFYSDLCMLGTRVFLVRPI